MTAGEDSVHTSAPRTWGVGPSFGYMEDLFRSWLEGAQPVEINRLLELVQEELDRRGQRLTYDVQPRPTGKEAP